MSPLARSGGSRHYIRYDFGCYELGWRYEVKYRGSRLLHHRWVHRTADYAGAVRFAKKWGLSVPGERQLWARRVRKTKANAWMPDRVIVLLDGRPGPEGVLMVCGWTAESKIDRWHPARITKNMKAITAQWIELHGKGWKLESVYDDR